MFLARGGRLDELVPGWTAGGEDIGRWRRRQATPAVQAKLRPGQPEQLRELGIEPEPEHGAAAGEGDAEGGGERGVVEGGAAAGGVRGRRRSPRSSPTADAKATSKCPARTSRP